MFFYELTDRKNDVVVIFVFGFGELWNELVIRNCFFDPCCKEKKCKSRKLDSEKATDF